MAKPYGRVTLCELTIGLVREAINEKVEKNQTRCLSKRSSNSALKLQEVFLRAR